MRKGRRSSKRTVKVAVGLSGGVDSAVAAALLVDPAFVKRFGEASPLLRNASHFVETSRDGSARRGKDFSSVGGKLGRN